MGTGICISNKFPAEGDTLIREFPYSGESQVRRAVHILLLTFSKETVTNVSSFKRLCKANSQKGTVWIYLNSALIDPNSINTTSFILKSLD